MLRKQNFRIFMQVLFAHIRRNVRMDMFAKKKMLLIRALSHRNAGHETPNNILCKTPLKKLTFVVLHAKLCIYILAMQLHCSVQVIVMCYEPWGLTMLMKKTSALRCSEIALRWQISWLLLCKSNVSKSHHSSVRFRAQGNMTILRHTTLMSDAFSKMIRKLVFEILCK